MASLQITGDNQRVLNALKQAEAIAAEGSSKPSTPGQPAPTQNVDTTLDQTAGGTITVTNNRESRTGYVKVWTF